MTRKKKLSVVLFAVLLCFILAFSLAACVDDPGDKKTHNETVRPYINELSKALSNSISADLANGFYAGFAGSVKIGNDEYSFDFDANILSKDKEGEEAANNNFRLVVKKADTVLFGLYNDKTNLYLEQGENKYNFANASVMKALRSVLVANIPNFSELTNLDAIEVMGSDLKSFVEDTMPLMFLILCQDPNEADTNANLMVAKDGDTYKVTIDLSNISSLGGMLGVGDLDLSFLEGIKVNLDVKVESEAIKKIDVSVAVGETNYAVSVTSKSTGGLFGAVKDDLDAQVPEALKAIEESSVIQTDFAGKINMVVAGEAGNTVLKTLDWKLVAKLDLFDLVDKNFMFSKISPENFFHFQLSHTCNDACANYCAKNVAAAQSAVLGSRYQKTSIIDIAWSPSTMDTNNLFVDVSLWDLLTNDGLDAVVSAIANMKITSLSGLGTMMISSQLTLNVDLDAVVMQDGTIARVTEGEEGGEGGEEGGEGGLSLDIMGILGNLGGLANFDGGALNLSVSGIKSLVTAIAGDGALIGTMTGADLVDTLLDTQNGVIALSLTCDKNDFGHNAKVAEYNTYESAVQYNMNGDKKQKVLDSGVTAYGALPGLGGKKIQGSPALYTESVAMKEGILDIYAKDAKGNYVLVADKDTALNNYDLETLYGGLKNLYFKYTYVDFNKEEQTAYGSIYGFQGLDLNKTATQNVTLLASVMTAESFNYTLQTNIAPLLALFGGSVDLPNIETLLPFAADSFECKIRFTANHEAATAEFIKDDVVTEWKKVYQINETVRTNAHAEFNVGAKRYSYPVKVENDIKKDAFGMMIPGTYTVTYTLDAKYNAKFANGTNVITETVVVEDFVSAKIVPNDELLLVTDNNGNMSDVVIGTLVYTLNDGTEARVELTWSKYYDKIDISGGEVLTKTRTALTFKDGGEYTFALRYDNSIILSWNYTVGSIQNVEMSLNPDLKLVVGENILEKTVLFSLKVEYSNVTKVREYTIADYKEFAIVDGMMGSKVTVTDESITFASAGEYFMISIKYAGESYSKIFTVGDLDKVEATANADLKLIASSNDLSGTLVTVVMSYTNGVTQKIDYLLKDVTITDAAGKTEGITIEGTNVVFANAGTYKFTVTQDGKKYSCDYIVAGIKTAVGKQGCSEWNGQDFFTTLRFGENAIGFMPIINLEIEYENGVKEELKFNLYDHTDKITITSKQGGDDDFVWNKEHDDTKTNIEIKVAGTYTVSVEYNGQTYSYDYVVEAPQA